MLYFILADKSKELTKMKRVLLKLSGEALAGDKKLDLTRQPALVLLIR